MNTYTYEIVENGYYININGQRTIAQLDQFAKLFVSNGTFEENAQAQIAELQTDENTNTEQSTEVEKIRSDVDYIAFMTEIDLTENEEVL